MRRLGSEMASNRIKGGSLQQRTPFYCRFYFFLLGGTVIDFAVGTHPLFFILYSLFSHLLFPPPKAFHLE